jgi:hypothetical protein
VAAAQPPDDEPAIQAALDAAYQAGGGTVTLPAGVHHIQVPLILRSNVRLKGAGMGSTIIRSMSGGFGGKVVDGADVYAAIAMVGADHAGVSDLTLDLFTNRTWTNGIVLLPTGAQWVGTPTTRSFVERVHVMGGGDHHAYMIWSLRGRHNKILNNIVDGGVPGYTSSVQEGIEVFGGADILISGNTVRNVGRACINITSALGAVADSDLVGVNLVNNDIEACGIGIYLSPVLTGQRADDLTQIHVRNNLLRRMWQAGILGTVVNGGRMDFVEIVGNSITGVGVPGGHGRGIWIEGLGGSASSILSIRGNVVADVTGFWGFGLYVVRYPGVSMSDNRIIRSGHTGILVFEAEDADVRANHILEAKYHAVWVGRGPRAMVRNNTIHKWAAAGAGAGVLVQEGERGIVTGNVFFRAAGAPEPYPVWVDATSIAVVVTENRLLYPTGLQEPFLNLSQPAP